MWYATSTPALGGFDRASHPARPGVAFQRSTIPSPRRPARNRSLPDDVPVNFGVCEQSGVGVGQAAIGCVADTRTLKTGNARSHRQRMLLSTTYARSEHQWAGGILFARLKKTASMLNRWRDIDLSSMNETDPSSIRSACSHEHCIDGGSLQQAPCATSCSKYSGDRWDGFPVSENVIIRLVEAVTWSNGCLPSGVRNRRPAHFHWRLRERRHG